MNSTLAQNEYQAGHVHGNKRPVIIAAIIILSTVASIAILLRILIQIWTRTGIKADDYLIFFAWLISWGSFVNIFYGMVCALSLSLSADVDT